VYITPTVVVGQPTEVDSAVKWSIFWSLCLPATSSSVNLCWQHVSLCHICWAKRSSIQFHCEQRTCLDWLCV